MKLVVSSWSLRSHVNKDFSLAQMPKVIKEKYGISAIEPCQPHFQRQDTKYLDELCKALEEVPSTPINMPVDTGNISQLDPEKRAHDLEIIKGWMRVARYVGSPAIRVNTGHQESDSLDLSITINSYKELVEFGKKLGVKVLLENHGGISADPDNIMKIFEGVADGNFGLCPDFGNFSSDLSYEGIEKMAKYAFIVHAKTYDFNEKGEQDEFDFGRCLRIIKESGFDGYMSVEFDGKGDQYQGVQKTIGLIEKYW